MADGDSPQRPSRYLSQRRIAGPLHATHGEDPLPALPDDAAVFRNKSRYHRKTDNVCSSPNNGRPATRDQQQADLPSRYHTRHVPDLPKPIWQTQVVQATPKRVRALSASRSYKSTSPEPALVPSLINQDEAAPFAEEEKVTERLVQPFPTDSAGAVPISSVSDALRLSPPTGELFPPPMPITKHAMGQGPPRSDQIRVSKSMSELPMHKDAKADGCFSLFRRRKVETAGVTDEKRAIERPMTAKGEPQAIKAGGGGIVPGTDAPISAVNAGDRRVLLECGKSRSVFPVTPLTTPVDLIKSAANCMSERIDVKSAVILEHFSTVGVQRPLRRYEHVRDVMNSWDNDSHNCLVLVDPSTGRSETELSLAGVPKSKPEERSWLLLLSQKPGKWDKRLVTLKPDGQIICQKDAGKSKDFTSICHLSDFDIYTPTAERIRKRIKPPKRYCFAIKSQQKTSMFESTNDFVHFFSTGDKMIADDFYPSVQAWRSWYLVNILGEGQKAKNVPQQQSSNQASRPAGDESTKAHHRNDSTASHYQLGSFQPLIDMGQFGKQSDVLMPRACAPSASDTFTKSASQFDPNVSPERRRNSTRQKHPPGSMQKRAQLKDDEPLANLNRRSSVDKRRPSSERSGRESNEFKSSSLLGRQYSQRQKEIAGRAMQQEQPFTAGPNLLNGGLGSVDKDAFAPLSGDGIQRHGSNRRRAPGSRGEIKRSSSVRSASGRPRGSSNDLCRPSSSTREATRPLVDLTPQYREPPQHAKKGKGFHLDAVGPGGLVDNATTADDPFGIPAGTDWRNRPAQINSALVDLAPPYQEPVPHSRNGRSLSSANDGPKDLVEAGPSSEQAIGTVERSYSRRRARAPSVKRPPTSRTNGEPFTGEGLLAAALAKRGWGDANKGRGVMDGSHANGKPMLDVSSENKFTQGTLLNRVEQVQGTTGPVLDREKRIERRVKYGEGL